VVVLGMHRSGTSAVAGVLHRLGLAVGTGESLVAPDATNRRGHWEVGPLVVINDRLLEAGGAAWDRVPDRFQLPVRPEWPADAAQALSTWQPHAPWVWKDPRLCLLLPFWRQVFPLLYGSEPVVVLCLRNPLEVAASLARRNHLPRGQALALWETYLHSALTALDGVPVLCSWYDDLLADPGLWIERAREFLVAQGVELDPGTAPHALAETDGDLRHHRFTAQDVAACPDVSARQQALFAVLERLADVSRPMAMTA
jgi:hypothetical protein